MTPDERKAVVDCAVAALKRLVPPQKHEDYRLCVNALFAAVHDESAAAFDAGVKAATHASASQTAAVVESSRATETAIDAAPADGTVH
jgi:hypothetical protein